MILQHKLVFHIPQNFWRDGYLEPIAKDISDNPTIHLIDCLKKAGADSMYLQAATGCYKGRFYNEELIVLFCELEVDMERAVDIFKEWTQVYSEVLQQERWAYEADGKLIIF